MTEPAYVARMREELDDILARLDALEAFLKGVVFQTLPFAEQELLTAQSHAMRLYASLLRARLNLITNRALLES